MLNIFIAGICNCKWRQPKRMRFPFFPSPASLNPVLPLLLVVSASGPANFQFSLHFACYPYPCHRHLYAVYWPISFSLSPSSTFPLSHSLSLSSYLSLSLSLLVLLHLHTAQANKLRSAATKQSKAATILTTRRKSRGRKRRGGECVGEGKGDLRQPGAICAARFVRRN